MVSVERMSVMIVMMTAAALDVRVDQTLIGGRHRRPRRRRRRITL